MGRWRQAGREGRRSRVRRRLASPSSPSSDSPRPHPAPSPHLPASFFILSQLHSHSLCPHSTPRPHSHRSSAMRRTGSTRATSPTNTTYSGISNYRTDSYKPLLRDASSKDYSNLDPRAVARTHFEELSQYLAAYLAKGTFLHPTPSSPSKIYPSIPPCASSMAARTEDGRNVASLVLFFPVARSQGISLSTIFCPDAPSSLHYGACHALHNHPAMASFPIFQARVLGVA